MTLKRKLNKARSTGNAAEAIRIEQRIATRNVRLSNAAFALYQLVKLAARIIGVQLPVTYMNVKKVDLYMNKFDGPASFIAELLVRLFADKPKFFLVGQRIVGALTVILAALKFLSDPATGLNLYDTICIFQKVCFVPEVVINYAIAMCVAIIAAFQLPTPPVNQTKAK